MFSMHAVQAGEDVVIANPGEPVARLVAVPATRPDLGSPQSVLDWMRDHPLPPHLQRRASEIEATIRVDRQAWD